MRYNVFYLIYVFAFLPHVVEAPIWVSVTSLLMAGRSYLAIFGYGPRVHPRLIGLLSVLAGAVIFLHYKTLLGPEAATSLLLLLAALKLEELRTDRDGVIFLFLCSLLVMYYLLFSQSLLATLHMLFMSGLILIGFVVAHTPREYTSQVLKSSPKLVMKDLLLSMPIFIVLFIFFPRFSMPWAYSVLHEKKSVGFSESLSPGEMATLVRSPEPAFRAHISSDKKIPLNQLYWRGLVLHETDGWSWRIKTNHKQSEVNTKTAQQKPRSQDTQQNDMIEKHLKYKIYLEPKYNKRLFVLDRTERIEWSDSSTFNPIHQTHENIFTSRFPVVSRVSYYGYKDVSQVEDETQKPNDTEAFKRDYLHITPPSESVQKLVRELRGGNRSDLEVVQRLLGYYQSEGFRYSIETPEMKTIDDFLFDKKIGFCEHFATATASLLRWLEVPSRVVSGFHGGQLNDFSDFILVRDQDAHTWVEAFIENKWVRIDPTSAVSPTRISTGQIEMALPNEMVGRGKDFLGFQVAQLQMAYAALEHRYNQFILNYNAGTQEDFFSFSMGSKQKRILLFLLSLVAVVLTYFLLQFALGRRVERDRYQDLLRQIRRDLNRKKVMVENHDPISRMLFKAKTKWPEKTSEFESLKVCYHRYRFQSATLSHQASPTEEIKFIHKKWRKIIAEVG